MTQTSFSMGIDWTRKGIICWAARPGDALNILPKPLTYSILDYRTTNVDSASLDEVDSPYGFYAFTVDTGTGVDSGLVLGQDDTLTVDDIPVAVSSLYGAAVWVRGQSNYAGVDFVLRVKDQTGATLFTSSAFTLTADWQQVSVGGSTGASSTHVTLEVVKDDDATDVVFQAAGFMLVAGSTIPSGYNTGETADLYDNVTEYVTAANWFLGMRKPYDEVSSDSMLKLTLTNDDQLFSPEYGSSALHDYLVPYRLVRVESDDGTTERTHYVGWIESIQPQVNQYGKRTVEITAAGPMLFFEDAETSIAIQENKRTDEIVAALLDTVIIPPPLTRTTLLDVTGHCELDINAYLFSTTVDNDLDQGKTTLAYAADNWVKGGQAKDDDEPDTFSVYRAIKDVAAAERGRFFFDREGQAVFWNRHHLLLNQTVEATFDDTMTELEYTFAGLGEFKNEVVVTCHPRTISAGSDELLWQLDKAVKIQPGQDRTLRAGYRDDSDNRIGGKDVHLENVSFSEGDARVALEEGANRATLTLTNTSSSEEAVLESCEIRGQKITDFGRMEAEAIDHTSVAYYGQRTLKMNLPSIDGLDFAQTIADFELARRKNPTGKVQSITLVSHGQDGGGQHAQQLARTLGDLIRVQESQTAHDNTYFIIGEAHRLSNSGSLYETTWYLESATDGNWFIIGTSKPDGTAVLAY